MNLIERGQKVLSNVLGHYTQLEVKSGKGAYLTTLDGRKILDFASGVAVTSTGHCHPKIVKAATKQLKTIIHNCAGVSYHPTTIEYLEALQKIVPIPDARFFLCQSGAEAIEGALKAAKYTSGKSGVIALKGGFHGRTIGALSITTSKKAFQEGYGALVPETFIAEHSLESIKALDNGNIAAIIFELVRGEGGYAAQDIDFVRAVRAYCDARGIYLIFDEVQSGFLRTGKMFAAEWYGVIPDIMAISKAIASGLPLGAVVMRAAISEKWKTSAHGGTFLGNLVSCAAGTATIEVLQAELPKMAAKIHVLEQLIAELTATHPQVFVGHQGLGFMVGINCASGEVCAAVRKKALALGLLLLNSGASGEVIRLAPPVIISEKDLRKGFAILAKAAECL